MNAPSSHVCLLVLAVAVCLCPADAGGGQASGSQGQMTLPSTAEMERDLQAALNAERTARGLQPLRLASDLVTLARRHSADLAGRNVVSHESAEGTSYQQRLTDAGVASVVNGENVGRSGTFLTPLIHQTFMDSPAHRQNILNPAFDSVGVGVALGDHGTYFVTVDFIKALTPRSTSEIRAMMLGALNRARARTGRAPVVLVDALHTIAEDLARARSEGRELPRVPITRVRTSTRFVAGADLDQLAAALGEERLDGFGFAGIGSAFGRTRDAPGGAYVICVLLVWDGS
jgi:hypothetical protein